MNVRVLALFLLVGWPGSLTAMADTPTLKFGGHRAAIGKKEYVFVFRKPAGFHLFYVGYVGPRPAYRIQTRDGPHGIWKDNGAGACGNGLDIYETSGRASQCHWSVQPWPGWKAFRVGVSYYTTRPSFEGPNPQPATLWSEAVEP